MMNMLRAFLFLVKSFIGTKASAEFDFYTGQLRVDYYNGKHTAVHQFRYQEGLASAAACLAAKRAAGEGRNVEITYGF